MKIKAQRSVCGTMYKRDIETKRRKKRRERESRKGNISSPKECVEYYVQERNRDIDREND